MSFSAKLPLVLLLSSLFIHASFGTYYHILINNIFIVLISMHVIHSFSLICSKNLIIKFTNLLIAAEMVCEDLPKEVCAFSVASSGKRCLLETEKGADGGVEYQCRTSEVVVERMAEYIETDQCVESCGVDRSSVGISSDAFFEPQFTGKLCSPACYQKCPNIVDLYFNLAAGEGKNK